MTTRMMMTEAPELNTRLTNQTIETLTQNPIAVVIEGESKEDLKTIDKKETKFIEVEAETEPELVKSTEQGVKAEVATALVSELNKVKEEEEKGECNEGESTEEKQKQTKK